MPRVLRAIRREHVESFIVALQDAGQRPTTVSAAYRSLQPFFRWALGKNEIEASPMERMQPPIVPEVRIPAKAISQSGVFDHPRSEAAERPTLGRGSPPDDHLLSGGCG